MARSGHPQIRPQADHGDQDQGHQEEAEQPDRGRNQQAPEGGVPVELESRGACSALRSPTAALAASATGAVLVVMAR